MFQNILIPTDGSTAVASAVETALDVAQRYDATLHVLHVVEPPTPANAMLEGAMSLDDAMRGLNERGRKATDDIAAQAEAEGVEAHTSVEKGYPRDDILSYATAHDIDLIVMGTHGRTGVKRTLLGSVSETVVRHADVPVLTVQREPNNYSSH